MAATALCGARARPLRWFADVRLARKHVHAWEFVRAYWPLGAADDAPPLDAAWRAGITGLGWTSSRWSTSLQMAYWHYVHEMLAYGHIGPHRLPERPLDVHPISLRPIIRLLDQSGPTHRTDVPLPRLSA